MTEQATSLRLTVQEAAEALGTSVDAVRMRVRRGSLDSDKASDGRVYVYLNGDSSETKHQLDGEPNALMAAKDETIELLREQLAEEREARRRADIMLTRLMDRLPELEAPQEERQEPQESPQRAPEGQDASGTRPGRQEPAGEAGQEARPWWRKIFGA